jgi:hypothetical protein
MKIAKEINIERTATRVLNLDMSDVIRSHTCE